MGLLRDRATGGISKSKELFTFLQPFCGVGVSLHNSVSSTNDLTIIIMTGESPFPIEQTYM